MEALQIEDLRILEDLIIEAIYDGLVKGKLDQKAYVFRVSDIAARDVRFEDLDKIISMLEGLQASAEDLNDHLQNSSAVIRDQRESDQQECAHLQARLVATKAFLKVSFICPI